MDNQYLRFTQDQFIVTIGPAFFQQEATHDYLSQSSWTPGVDAGAVRISIQNSLCFALLDGTRQVGFARLVTDYATFGCLCGVYVLNEYQKSGLGHWLIEYCHTRPVMSRLRRVMLVTSNTPRLYQKLRYNPLNQPDFVWQVSRPDIYHQPGQK